MRGPKAPPGVQDDIDDLIARAKAKQAELKQTPAAAAAAPPEKRDLPVVVIDPGHGGVDPGAAGPAGASEKDIVLAFAKRLKEKIEAGGVSRVVLTRDDDNFISLPARVKVARDNAASLMISIHADTLVVIFVLGCS